MATLDIMPLISPLGGHVQVVHYPMDAAAAFLAGEPVGQEADGQIIEAATQPDATVEPGATSIVGIAAVSAANAQYAKTGSTTVVANTFCPVYTLSNETLFITKNLFAGSDTLVVPAASNLGDKGGLRLTAGGVWGVDISSAAGVTHYEIVQVLDSLKRDVSASGGTGVYIIFRRCEE